MHRSRHSADDSNICPKDSRWTGRGPPQGANVYFDFGLHKPESPVQSQRSPIGLTSPSSAASERRLSLARATRLKIANPCSKLFASRASGSTSSTHPAWPFHRAAFRRPGDGVERCRDGADPGVLCDHGVAFPVCVGRKFVLILPPPGRPPQAPSWFLRGAVEVTPSGRIWCIVHRRGRLEWKRSLRQRATMSCPT
jgi:hypothetical protein